MDVFCLAKFPQDCSRIDIMLMKEDFRFPHLDAHFASNPATVGGFTIGSRSKKKLRVQNTP